MQFGNTFTPGRLFRLLALVAVLGSALLNPVGTRTISVAAADCARPDPITLAAGPPAATPIGDDDATPIASPEGTATASPRQLLAAGLENLVKTFAACRSEGNFETMTRLVTEKYLGAVYGGGPRLSRSSFLSMADDLLVTQVRFRGFDDLVIMEPGSARANVKLIVGKQLTFERMTFVEEKRRPGSWLIDTTTPLRVQPPRQHADTRVTMTGNRFNPAALVADNRNVEIRAVNSDDEDHEMLVLALPDGMTTAQLLWNRGPALPEGVKFIGQVTIPARSSGNLVLVGLNPGTYVVVDLLPSENGVPHLSLGMEATLTIGGD